MNARYRAEEGGATRFVHTLNGSGVAVGRALDRRDGELSARGRLDRGAGRAAALYGRIEARSKRSERAERAPIECASSSPTTTASTRRASTRCETDRARALRRRLGGGARRPTSPASRIRSRSTIRCACARSASGALPSRARRPTASSWACATSSTDKRPDLVLSGVNRGQQRRRGRDLFGHDRRRHGGHDARHPVDRAVARPMAAASATAAALGDAPMRMRPDIIRKRAGRRHAARRAGQRQFPRLRAGRGQGHRRRPPRASATRNCCASSERHDGRGNPYYWIAFARLRSRRRATAPTSSALADNRISVTPLRLDLTDEPFMTQLAAVLMRGAEYFASWSGPGDR